MILAGSQMKSSLRWLGSPRGRQALTTELARRRLVDFTTYTAPWYRPAQVHRFLAEQLEAVERGDLRRLMVQQFKQLLRPGGYLVVGMAESLSAVAHGMKAIEPSVYQLS